MKGMKIDYYPESRT